MTLSPCGQQTFRPYNEIVTHQPYKSLHSQQICSRASDLYNHAINIPDVALGPSAICTPEGGYHVLATASTNTSLCRIMLYVRNCSSQVGPKKSITTCHLA